ncbi:MAG: hypothetical protein WDW36_006877 [Sanguina aurantia]
MGSFEVDSVSTSPEPPKSQSFASQPFPSLAVPQSSSCRFAAQSLPKPTSALASQPPAPITVPSCPSLS